MHVGLDFDNTLACYDRVFVRAARQQNLLPDGWSGGKRALRDYLRCREGGEEVWQALQGLVYGSLMDQATLNCGVGWFLMQCKARGVQISIVSHKTEYSPKDPLKVPLRKKALRWMEQNGFFDPDRYGISQASIYFENTREEKISRINSIGCEFFVDDLPEVLAHQRLLSSVNKILYCPSESCEPVPRFVTICQDWSSIGNIIIGEESRKELLLIAQAMMPNFKATRCERVTGVGNSKIYKVSQRGKPSLALKRYPSISTDARDRLGTEVNACHFLRDHGIQAVPSVSHTNEINQIGVFEWIEGETITSPTKKDFQEIVAFIRQLDGLRKVNGAQELSLASEACLSGLEICRQIHVRRNRLARITIEYPEIRLFLMQEFDPVFLRAQDWARHHWPIELSFDDKVPSDARTLSVSDLGFHNALREHSGSLRIVDLEYFGWDDPVKVASDFCWHPGMTLDEELLTSWIREMTEIFVRDKSFVGRLRAAHPLLGLRWAMIVLNPFLTRGCGNHVTDETLDMQLEKSRSLCRRVELLI